MRLYDETFAYEFWDEMETKLQWLYGRAHLTEPDWKSASHPVKRFLEKCQDESFLNFVELAFKSEYMKHLRIDFSGVRADVNSFFEVDDLAYFLTDFEVEPGHFRGYGGYPDTSLLGKRVLKYPQVVRRDNTLIHDSVIVPSLNLLSQAFFSSANDEFLEALAHFRKGEYPDCLTKCGSSFESVMKVICDRKGWSYNQTDTASTLLDNVFSHTTLDPFFKQPIILVATIRNRLSGSHGAGTQPRYVTAHVANFALNATASSILLLVAETNP